MGQRRRDRRGEDAAAKARVHGQPIVMATLAGDATSSQIAQLMQAEAKQAGINVEIKPLQPIEYSNATVDPKARQGLDVMLAVSFNGAPNPLEPMRFDYLPDSFYNYTGYDNNVVNRRTPTRRPAPTRSSRPSC